MVKLAIAPQTSERGTSTGAHYSCAKCNAQMINHIESRASEMFQLGSGVDGFSPRILSDEDLTIHSQPHGYRKRPRYILVGSTMVWGDARGLSHCLVLYQLRFDFMRLPGRSQADKPPRTRAAIFAFVSR